MKAVDYVVLLVLRPRQGSQELLLLRRAEGKYMGGTWQLVSGGIEPGETAWQAAVRELREETGLVPREFYRLSTLTRFYRADNDSLNTGVMFCALVDPAAEVVLDAENTAWTWSPLAAASPRLMWPSDREALREVIDVILGDGPARPHLRLPLPPPQ